MFCLVIFQEKQIKRSFPFQYLFLIYYRKIRYIYGVSCNSKTVSVRLERLATRKLCIIADILDLHFSEIYSEVYISVKYKFRNVSPTDHLIGA